nr:hypothetical protein [Bacteroides intestinalis]
MGDFYYLVLCYKNRDQQVPVRKFVCTAKGFSEILSSLHSEYAYVVVEHLPSMHELSVPKELE